MRAYAPPLLRGPRTGLPAGSRPVGGRASDAAERSAERIADTVMRSSASCPRPGWELTDGEAAAVGHRAPDVVCDVIRSPGRPLDSGTREFFEPRFGHDFSQV